MPFKPGHNLSKGRPKGASNKSTETIKRSISMLLENNIDTVQSDLDEMQPRDRVNALLQFMKFVIPTQKAVEIDTRTSQEELNEAYIQKLMDIPKKILISTMTEIEKYLESKRALDEKGKPDESLFRVKMYKSMKAAKISGKLY